MQPATACPYTPVLGAEQDAVRDGVALLGPACFAPGHAAPSAPRPPTASTLAAAALNLVRRWGRALSLLLTELGELLLDGAHAPAGVKRRWRLLKARTWTAQLVSGGVATRAGRSVPSALAQAGGAAGPGRPRHRAARWPHDRRPEVRPIGPGAAAAGVSGGPPLNPR
jgi:hypothetical protein